jgi:protein-arginine kinase activator protein McsA
MAANMKNWDKWNPFGDEKSWTECERCHRRLPENQIWHMPNYQFQWVCENCAEEIEAENDNEAQQ